MLRVARMASTMTFVVVAVLSWAQCILMEMTLPHGATATISLDVGQTSLSKAQILGDLQGSGSSRHHHHQVSLPPSGDRSGIGWGAPA